MIGLTMAGMTGYDDVVRSSAETFAARGPPNKTNRPDT